MLSALEKFAAEWIEGTTGFLFKAMTKNRRRGEVQGNEPMMVLKECSSWLDQ